MKTRYLPNGSFYREYYEGQQRGAGNFPVYTGRRYQRGHGIGNILGRVFRTVLPFLKRIAPVALRAGAQVVENVSSGRNFKESAKEAVQPIVPQLLKTGQQVVGDIVSGQDVKESLKRGIKTLVQPELNQSGSGLYKRRKTKRSDIFDN